MIDWPTHDLAKPIEREIEAVAASFPGWQDALRSKQMCHLILEQRPSVVVEIGVYAGRSFLPMSWAVKHNGSGGVCFGIDPYDKNEIENSRAPDENWEPTQDELDKAFFECTKYILQNRLPGYLLREKSQDAYGWFDDESIGFLHIDGGHGEQNALQDVELYTPKVKPKGYIWFDDSNWPSTQKAIRRLEALCTLESDQGTYRVYRKR